MCAVKSQLRASNQNLIPTTTETRSSPSSSRQFRLRRSLLDTYMYTVSVVAPASDIAPALHARAMGEVCLSLKITTTTVSSLLSPQTALRLLPGQY